MFRNFLLLVAVASRGESGHVEDSGMVRRHELEATVDSAGHIKSRHWQQDHQSRRSLMVASPAIPSSADPADADELAQPPSPAEFLISANTMTEPPAANTEPGNFVESKVPVTTKYPSKDLQKVHKRVGHRMTMTTLALCMLFSGILGMLVVWRQAKVLLNKPRRGEEPEDFREQVAKVLKRASQSSATSVRSQAKGSHDMPRALPSQASSSAQVAQVAQVAQAPVAQVESDASEVPAAPSAPSAPSTAAVATVEASDVSAQEEMFDANFEADAAGGGVRKSQAKTQ